MKVFDLHIGLSDAILQLKKDPTIEGMPEGSFPNQFDFVRAEKGNLDTFCGMICPIELDGHKGEIRKHIQVFKKLEESGQLEIFSNFKELGVGSQELADSRKLKAILGLEGVYFVNDDSDLEFLDELIEQGIRIIGLKWNLGSKLFPENKLTSLGNQFLQLCEEKRIIVDLAHSEADLIGEILSNFNGAIINSHTCMFAIHETPRNIRDEFIQEIVNRKGLVGINFVGEFIGGNTINQLMKHFEYFINKFGIDNLAIGSDFDGMEDTDLIKDLEDVSKYQNLVNAFQELGLNNEEIEKVLFTNAGEFFQITN
jgi:microsomal dipeptidase-like Zn-dependent dipeptidase